LMEKGSQKTQAYPWICRGFLGTLDPQEIGADQDKNRSIQVILTFAVQIRFDSNEAVFYIGISEKDK
jgi:hypothetical protein